jgi:translation elongation factor EF-G
MEVITPEENMGDIEVILTVVAQMTWEIEMVLRLLRQMCHYEMFGYVTTLRTLSSGRAKHLQCTLRGNSQYFRSSN